MDDINFFLLKFKSGFCHWTIEDLTTNASKCKQMQANSSKCKESFNNDDYLLGNKKYFITCRVLFYHFNEHDK